MPEKEKVKWLPQGRSSASTRWNASPGSWLLWDREDQGHRRGAAPQEDARAAGRKLTSIPGIRSVDMTSNGWYLEQKAESLREAGLRGVTVSLHSLRSDRFAKIRAWTPSRGCCEASIGHGRRTAPGKGELASPYEGTTTMRFWTSSSSPGSVESQSAS